MSGGMRRMSGTRSVIGTHSVAPCALAVALPCRFAVVVTAVTFFTVGAARNLVTY